MNAPILLGDGGTMSPADAARLSALASHPYVQRMLDAGFDARNEDKALLRLMSEAAEMPLARRYAAHLMGDRPHLMGLDPSAVHVPTGIPNQFVMYANRDLIADLVLPPVAVSKISDKIWSTPQATMQSIANTSIAGSRARPNEVAYSVSASQQYTCEPYGLIDFIDANTIANADSPLDPRVLSGLVIKSFLDLARESRVASAAFNSSNYGTNTEALAGADRWDQPSSDPVAALLAAKETMFSTPNTLVLGGQVWPKLRTNPNVLKYILGRAKVSNLGDVPAQMQMQFLAEILEVDRVIVGRAKVLSNQEGGTASQSYLWGKSAALLRVEPNPNPRMTQTFGYTYRFGGMSYRNEVIPDRMPGTAGGEYVKMTTMDDEFVLGSAEAANPTGYLFTTVIS